MHFHPYGIYQDAPYHTAHGNSIKSPRPLDGQLALDHSIQFKKSSCNRIGISNGEFVVLNKTSEGLYHGHVRTFNKLDIEMQKALKRANLVNNRGKIIVRELL